MKKPRKIKKISKEIVLNLEDKDIKKAKGYSKKDLKFFKELLLKTKVKLLEKILTMEKENLNKSQKDASGDLSGYSIHMADVATDSYDREFSLDRVSSEHKVIYELDEALSRVKEGDYGLCVSCGEKIAPKRLTAIPYAKYCIACQNTEELNKKKSHEPRS